MSPNMRFVHAAVSCRGRSAHIHCTDYKYISTEHALFAPSFWVRLRPSTCCCRHICAYIYTTFTRRACEPALHIGCYSRQLDWKSSRNLFIQSAIAQILYSDWLARDHMISWPQITYVHPLQLGDWCFWRWHSEKEWEASKYASDCCLQDRMKDHHLALRWLPSSLAIVETDFDNHMEDRCTASLRHESLPDLKYA